MLTLFLDYTYIMLTLCLSWAYRFETIRRRTQFRLEKLVDRSHLVDGFIVALDNIDQVHTSPVHSADSRQQTMNDTMLVVELVKFDEHLHALTNRHHRSKHRIVVLSYCYVKLSLCCGCVVVMLCVLL